MIVTCERCETQFQLDEARVPESGARVRCSRCKHAFVVHPPSARAEAGIEQAVSDAVRVGETPDVTEDLPDPVAEAASEDANADSDWQFNHDDSPTADGEESDSDTDFGVVGPGEHLALAGEGDEAPSDALAFETDEDDSPFDVASEDMRAPAAAAPAPASARGGTLETAPEGAETLGTPDEWDIFDDLSAGGKTPPPSAPAQTPLANASQEIAADASQERAVDATNTRPGASRFASRADARLWLGRAGGVAGWALTAVLCAIGFVKGLAPPTAASPEIAIAPGLRVEAAGRWVDNARLGKLFVVSGQLRREGSASEPMPPLELVMLDAAGRTLEPSWPLDSPRPDASLREGRSDALSAVRAGFRRPLQAGEAREFEAVAWPLPREADRFEIRVAEAGR